MKTLVEYLETKIQGCDELGGMEREKWAFQQVLKEISKTQEDDEEKLSLIVKFISGARYADDPRLEKLDELDEIRNKVYFEHRIKRGFEIAYNMANTAVIKHILK